MSRKTILIALTGVLLLAVVAIGIGVHQVSRVNAELASFSPAKSALKTLLTVLFSYAADSDTAGREPRYPPRLDGLITEGYLTERNFKIFTTGAEFEYHPEDASATQPLLTIRQGNVIYDGYSYEDIRKR